MAKITVVGDAIVVTSIFSLEEIKMIEKYRPDDLILKSDDGNEPIFKIGVKTTSGGTLNKYGAEFATETHDDNKKAVITMFISGDSANIKDKIVEELGQPIINLNKLEAKLPNVLREIKEEHEKILENIEIVQ